MIIEWEHSTDAWVLALLPILVAVWAWYRLWRKRSLTKLGNPAHIRQLVPDTSRSQNLRVALFILALTLGCLALLSPRFPETVTAPDIPTADVVFVVDVSTSMLAADVPPSRLARVKQILSQAMPSLEKSRVGVVLYAAQAYPFLPLTDDLPVAASFVPAIQPTLIAQQGTRLGKAMEMAGYFFSDTVRNNQVIFLISDGENHDAAFEASVQALARRRIVTHTLGIGTEAGTSIQLINANGSTSVKTDAAGQPVVTRLEAGNLRRIAEAGRGQYWQATSISEAVQFITQRIESARLSIGKPPQVTGYRYLFQWLVGAALACLLVEMVLPVIYQKYFQT
jgi:Ca-activated chloride channel family protein